MKLKLFVSQDSNQDDDFVIPTLPGQQHRYPLRGFQFQHSNAITRILTTTLPRTREASLLTSSLDASSVLWSRHGDKIAGFVGHKKAVNDICIVNNGSTFVSASQDGTIRVWDMKTQACVREIKTPGSHSVNTITVNESTTGDELILYCGCQNGRILAYDLKSRDSKDRDIFRQQSSNGSGDNIAASPRSSISASSSNSSLSDVSSQLHQHMTSTASTSTASTSQSSPSQQPMHHSRQIYCLQLYPIHNSANPTFAGASLVLLSGAADCTVKFWNANDGKLIKTKTFSEPVLKIQRIGDLFFALHYNYVSCWHEKINGEERKSSFSNICDFSIYNNYLIGWNRLRASIEVWDAKTHTRLFRERILGGIFVRHLCYLDTHKTLYYTKGSQVESIPLDIDAIVRRIVTERQIASGLRRLGSSNLQTATANSSDNSDVISISEDAYVVRRRGSEVLQRQSSTLLQLPNFQSSQQQQQQQVIQHTEAFMELYSYFVDVLSCSSEQTAAAIDSAVKSRRLHTSDSIHQQIEVLREQIRSSGNGSGESGLLHSTASWQLQLPDADAVTAAFGSFSGSGSGYRPSMRTSAPTPWRRKAEFRLTVNPNSHWQSSSSANTKNSSGSGDGTVAISLSGSSISGSSVGPLLEDTERVYTSEELKLSFEARKALFYQRLQNDDASFDMRLRVLVRSKPSLLENLLLRWVLTDCGYAAVSQSAQSPPPNVSPPITPEAWRRSISPYLMDVKGNENDDLTTRQALFYSLLEEELINTEHELFTLCGNCINGSNRNDNKTYYLKYFADPSALTDAHLLKLRGVGRLIGHLISREEAPVTKLRFTRPLFKMIVGKPLSLEDLEYVDPSLFLYLDNLLKANDIRSILAIATYEESPALSKRRSRSINPMMNTPETTMTAAANSNNNPKLRYVAESIDYDYDYRGQRNAASMTTTTQYVDLMENGSEVNVTEQNKFDYVKTYAKWRLVKSIRKQIDALLTGVYEVVPRALLSAFDEVEVEHLMCGSVAVDVSEWRINTVYWNGYTNDHNVIEWFWDIVHQMSQNDRCKLLSLTTGTLLLARNTLSELLPRFMICRVPLTKSETITIDKEFHRLDLPEFETKEQLEEAIHKAIL